MTLINRRILISDMEFGTPKHKKAGRSMRRGSFADQIMATSVTQTKYNKAVSALGLTPEEMLMRLDLEDVMNLHPTTLHQDTPFQRTYSMFQMLGLRHLFVHDDDFNLVGVITREDLFRVEHSNHHHGSNKGKKDEDTYTLEHGSINS